MQGQPCFPTPFLTGYVLAGGASSRMGRDKALLELNGRTLVEIAVSKLREVCWEVAILCGGDSTPQRLAALQQVARTVPEAGRYEGPLAGISAALNDAQTAWALVIAVDQPFLPVQLLEDWFAVALSSGASASCMVLGETVQPIPLLIQPTAGGAVAKCMATGERRVRSALDGLSSDNGVPSLHRFSIEETAQAGAWFRNLNSPADLL